MDAESGADRSHNEHPQTIALILAHLKPAQAAELFGLLPANLLPDVLKPIASLDDISPDIIGRISTVMMSFVIPITVITLIVVLVRKPRSAA